MILSHLHKFVFIKGRKVAGTSIEIALSEICGPDDVLTPLWPADERSRLQARNYSRRPKAERAWLDAVRNGASTTSRGRQRYYNHMPLAEVVKLAGDLSGYQVLFAERSPYAKVLSLLNWRLGANTYDGSAMQSHDAEQLQESFDERYRAALNIDLYRLTDGTIPSPGWRVEDLGQSVSNFFELLGCPSPTALPQAKAGIKADTLDPRQWLQPHQIAAINEAYAEEFTQFGYPMLDPTAG